MTRNPCRSVGFICARIYLKAVYCILSILPTTKPETQEINEAQYYSASQPVLPTGEVGLPVLGAYLRLTRAKWYLQCTSLLEKSA